MECDAANFRREQRKNEAKTLEECCFSKMKEAHSLCYLFLPVYTVLVTERREKNNENS